VHHLDPAAQRADHERRNRLRVLGWRVFVFTAADVQVRPERIAAVLGPVLRG